MKNKKPILFIIILLLALVVIGVTVAYYTSNDTFSNEFNTSVYKMIAEENFQSPDNWTPGTTTPKEVYAINKGDVEAAVRIKIEESWIGNDNTELDLSDSHDNRAAIINFTNNPKWVYNENDGYYYYIYSIEKDEQTELLFDSVTFNPVVEIEEKKIV